MKSLTRLPEAVGTSNHVFCDYAHGFNAGHATLLSIFFRFFFFFFFLHALLLKSKFANFCHDSIQNLLSYLGMSGFVIPMYT